MPAVAACAPTAIHTVLSRRIHEPATVSVVWWSANKTATCSATTTTRDWPIAKGGDWVEAAKLVADDGAVVGLRPALTRGVPLGDVGGADLEIHLGGDAVAEIDLDAPGAEAVLLDVDGETPGKLPATFELLPGALRLKVPGRGAGVHA